MGLGIAGQSLVEIGGNLEQILESRIQGLQQIIQEPLPDQDHPDIEGNRFRFQR